MKKLLTLFTALLFFGSMTAIQAADTYVVAGSSSDLFGSTWAASAAANQMTWDDSRSLYVKTYTATAAMNGVELKVVKNGNTWNGDFMGNNVKFNVSGAGSFDVLFNATTGVAFVEGANVVPTSMYSVYAAGDGSGNWLNGKSWDAGAAANKMTEVEMNVWEITFNNVASGTNRQIKFTVNGGWDVNFGGTFSSFGTATNAVSGGSNITFNMTSASTISARLDLRNCKASDKSGAKFTIANGALPDLHNCFVAGSATDILGSAWNASAAANKMTWDAMAGKYSKTYTVTKAYKSVSLKAVYDGVWFGDNGENVKFSLSGAGTFTVLFDKNTKQVTIEGDIVGPEQFDFEYVTATGNGSGNWLNGKDWDAGAAANRMTEVATDIYEITYQDVPGSECQFKFSFNGGWDYEIGGVFSEYGTATAAVYGNTAGTITFTPVENADITIRLDLSNFNFATKEGATFTVTQILPPPPTIKMNGTFADGSTMAETDAFAIESGNATASITLTLTAGDYEFKVLSAGNPRSNGHTYHREYIGATGISADNTNNMKLEADADGDYTFTWDYEHNGLSITFPAEPTPVYAEITFFAPRDETNKWDHVYAYSYKGSRKFLGEWPGTEITSTKNAGWYTVSVRKGSNLIFTDNAGMQTNDILDIQADACYESTSIYYPEDPTEAKKVTVTANAGCEIAYYIAGVKELVGGTADWQINLPLDEENKIVFQDVEPGTYAFKINNNSWAWSIGGIDHMKAGDCASIAQEVGVGDLGFKIDTKQDVTVTYYPATQEICLGAVTVKATGTADAADMNIKSGESKKITYTTNNTENPNVTYTVLSGSEYIGLFQGVITGIKAGTATVRVSLAETANYTAASDEFTIMISNPVAPAEAIAPVGGKFIINAKGDTAVFSRGNLKYNVATGEWYCADHQYDFVGEGGNLHFGDANYTGEFDLFGWSCTASNYGLMQSNHDDVYTGEFVDWGGLFAGGEQEWVTPTGNELYYIINHHQWTIMALDPTPEDADNEDEIYGLAIFPIGWVQPAGFDDLTYSYSNWWDEETIAKNTFALSKWSDLEAAGAVFLPHAGARAGHWGNDWNGKATVSTKNPNPNGGNSYCFVDNIGWYGYYWSSTTDPRSEHPYDAQYLITPGWSEGPTDADEDDLYIQPQVWSREKRRGNSVRLVTRIPRRYTVTYDAGGAAGTVPVDDNTYLPGDNVVLGAQGDLAKDGFTFAGWNDGNATYDAGANYTMPEKDVTLTAQWNSVYTTVRTGLETNRYYTVCLPRQVTDATGATFWNLQYRNSGNTEVYLEEATLPYEAGKPFIIQATADHLNVLYEGDAVLSPVENGALRGTLVDLSESELASKGSDVYLLIQNAIRPITAGNYLDANRAYILYDELIVTQSAPIPAPGKRVRAIPMQGQTATGMDNVQGDDVQCTKVLIDGQLYILRANRMYDVTGKLVK